jgi:tol-pal system protein YbgF
VKRRASALPLVLLLASGCSSAPRLVPSAELDSRERHILELERRASSARAENEALRARIAELERQCAASPLPPSTAPPPAPVPIEEPVVAPPRPVEIEASDLEESDLVDAQSAPATSDSAARYEAALVALRDGRNEEAERALLAFAQEESGSDLADNAWYWLAESRLARGHTAGAIEAYRTAIDRYPEGNKIPDALLKLGVAFEAVGNRAAAREAWAELVRRFPTSAAAETAAERLETP